MGFDHRVGHLWPLRMPSESSNTHFLKRLGAFASHLGSWGGRRHDRGQKAHRDFPRCPGDCPRALSVFNSTVRLGQDRRASVRGVLRLDDRAWAHATPQRDHCQRLNHGHFSDGEASGGRTTPRGPQDLISPLCQQTGDNLTRRRSKAIWCSWSIASPAAVA
jgi:hypothetical protein